MTPEDIARLVKATHKAGKMTQEQSVAAVQAIVEKWDGILAAVHKELRPENLWDVPEIAAGLGAAVTMAWAGDAGESAGSRALKTSDAIEAGYATEETIIQRGVPGPIRLASKAFASAPLRLVSFTPSMISTAQKAVAGIWDGAKLAVAAELLREDVILLAQAVIDQSSAASIRARMDEAFWPAHAGVKLIREKVFKQTNRRWWKKARTRAEPEGEGFAKAVKRGRERVKRGGTARKGRGQSK